MSIEPHALMEDINNFWFGDNDGETVPDRQVDMWFNNGRYYDQEIGARYEALIDRVAAGAFDYWSVSAAGRLALLVALDQFPRHVYRGTARSFAYDAKAREHCLSGIAANQHLELSYLQQAIFYLPLEHAEDRALQERSVALYAHLATQVRDENKATYLSYHHYASLHRDIVVRFGQFPHRNELLGRASSATETAFLLEPNSSFL
jgi:uncharacterized protein (DUF924 family)